MLPKRDAKKTNFYTTLGKRIRAARERTKLSAKDFASELGISERQLSRYESGKGNIDSYQLARIALISGEGLESLVADLEDLVEGSKNQIPLRKAA
jgi:transcriptional regulator with XRE-family HTH domain